MMRQYQVTFETTIEADDSEIDRLVDAAARRIGGDQQIRADYRGGGLHTTAVIQAPLGDSKPPGKAQTDLSS